MFAPDLTRRAIFDALKRRRCYATNGPRILLDVRLDGHFMGERFESVATHHELVATAQGRSIGHIDVWKDGRIIHTEDGRASDAVQFQYVDASPPDRRESYYYVRVIQEGMGIAWSSPIWVRHTQVEPRLCLYVDGKVVETVESGATVRLPILLRNETVREVAARLDLDIPPEWQCDWQSRGGEVPAEWWSELSVELTAPLQPYEGTRAIRVTMTSEVGRAVSEVRFAVRPRGQDAQPAA